MQNLVTNMQALEKITHDFCTDPANILIEKRFLIRRFFLGLGAQIQAIFEQAHTDCNQWLKIVIDELRTQIHAHKKALDTRAESLMDSHTSADKLIHNLELSEKEFTKYLKQSNQLDAILLKLMNSAKFNTEKSAAFTSNLEFNLTQPSTNHSRKTAPLLDAPFIGESHRIAIS
jgi:hypothetical protein